MKKLLGNLSLLAGLACSLLLLAACRSQKPAEKNEASSSRQTQQSSAHSQKAKASSSQTDSGSESSSPEASSSSSASSDQASTDAKASQAPAEDFVPADLVGTWSWASLQASRVEMTVTKEGTVRTFARFDQYDPATEDSREVQARAVSVGPNLYRWEVLSGDPIALLPGVTGLGGAGFKSETGFRLEGGRYTPVLYTAALDQDIDYANYYDLGFSLSK